MEERDFELEVRALYEKAPELKGQELPQEVVDACMDGKSVSQAYDDYQKAKKPKPPAVKGLSGGGATGQMAEDAFLKGFNTAW